MILEWAFGLTIAMTARLKVGHQAPSIPEAARLAIEEPM